MSSFRIGARLAGLSQEQLIELIDKQAHLWSAAALRVAEDHAAQLVEQPEWILSEVLLSPDLVPHILAQLPTKEHAAKATCRAWRRGWKETLARREGPRMLVVGGYSEGENGDHQLISSLERYDPSTNEWEEEAVAPMPTARDDVCMGEFDGKLYAAGGRGEEDTASSLVEWYDFATNAWEVVASMVTARSDLASAVLGGKLYAVGGDGDGLIAGVALVPVALSSVERYDPATNAWEAVAPMATARSAHAVAVLDGMLYAVGGYDRENGGHLSSVERYDLATNAWEAVAPMAEARAAHAMAVLDGKLYAVGGFNGYYCSSVERYDPALDAWEAVAPMAVARNQPGVLVLDGKLYAVGGYHGDTANASSSVERYDPAANAWEAVAALATARFAHVIVVA